MTQAYEDAKVGDDLELLYRIRVGWLAIEPDSATITIVRASTRERVVDGATATVNGAYVSYLWKPSLADDFIVAWHVVHGGGTDHYSPVIRQRVNRRISPASGAPSIEMHS